MDKTINKEIKKIIYISNPINSAVVQSQVYELLEYYVNLDLFEEVILIQIYNNKPNYQYAKNTLKKYHFKKIFIRGKFGLLVPYNPLQTKIKKVIQKLIIDNNFIIHVRTEMLGYFVINTLKCINKPLNVLIDIRGTTYEEIDYRMKLEKNKPIYSNIYFKLAKKSYKKLPLFYAKNNVTISVVSEKLKEYLINNNFNNPILVHPNIASNKFKFNIMDRKKIRQKLNLNDNQIVVVMSSSGGNIWQKDHLLINYFSNKENYTIINLSKTPVNKRGVINMFIPYEKMPEYLSAADIAILWRDNIILNNCSSPSKFSEFAAMGLYIIHNNSVDLATNYIIKNNAGYVTEDIDKIEINASLILNINERIKRSIVGQNKFGINNIAKSYYKSYLNIIKTYHLQNKY